jgi:hypothetical protein
MSNQIQPHYVVAGTRRTGLRTLTRRGADPNPLVPFILSKLGWIRNIAGKSGGPLHKVIILPQQIFQLERQVALKASGPF